MSDDGGSTARTTTRPPPSRGPPGNSIVSSSQLSPKASLPSWYTDAKARESDRNSWGEPGEERRIDRRRKSNVTFGGATSVAPSESISRVQTRPGRGSRDFSGSASQYSHRSKHRSSYEADDVERRSVARSTRAASSNGGSRAAPLTERNVEAFNEESQSSHTEQAAEREVERDIEIDDRKSGYKSRRDSGVVTRDAPRSEERSMGAKSHRSKHYSRAGYDEDPPSAQRTVASTRRKTEVVDDGPTEEVKTKSKSRYETYDDEEASNRRTVGNTRRGTEVEADKTFEETKTTTKSRPAMSRYRSYDAPTQSSQSKVTTKRQSRAADVYAQSAQRRASKARTAWNSQANARTPRRSMPPTVPPESNENVRYSRDLEVVGAGAGAAAASRYGSRAQTQARVESDSSSEHEEARQTEVKSERYAQREVEEDRKSEHYSQREVENDRKSERYSSYREDDVEEKTAAAETYQTARQSKAPSRAPSRPSQAVAATAANGPSQRPESPQSADSPTSPTRLTDPNECQWERKVHIIETRKPNGKLIQDREVTMRRIRPAQQVTA